MNEGGIKKICASTQSFGEKPAERHWSNGQDLRLPSEGSGFNSPVAHSFSFVPVPLPPRSWRGSLRIILRIALTFVRSSYSSVVEHPLSKRKARGSNPRSSCAVGN